MGLSALSGCHGHPPERSGSRSVSTEETELCMKNLNQNIFLCAFFIRR